MAAAASLKVSMGVMLIWGFWLGSVIRSSWEIIKPDRSHGLLIRRARLRRHKFRLRRLAGDLSGLGRISLYIDDVNILVTNKRQGCAIGRPDDIAHQILCSPGTHWR